MVAPSQMVFQISDSLNLISIEAEIYSFTKASASGYSWSKATAFSGFSGGAYMTYDNPTTSGDSQERYFDPIEARADAPKIGYLINFLDTGRYYFYFRVSFEDADSDSFHYSSNGDSITNGTKVSGVGLRLNELPLFFSPNVWQWWNTYDARGRAYLDVTEPGLDTLEIYAREENLRLDKIILTKDLAYAPDSSVLATSLGPDETLVPIVDKTPPVFTSATTGSFDEQATGTVYTAVATDETGVTYQLTGDVDDALFTLDSVTGQLAFITPPDFENPQDENGDNVYMIQITATDTADNSTAINVAVTVNDLDENAPVFTSATTGSFDEQATGTVYAAVATDETGVTYRLTGDVDDALFTLDSVTGQLAFITPPDFENPQDENGDNVYMIQITATDTADNSTAINVAVTVNDLDENAPVFTSASTGSFDEQATGTVYTAVATDETGVTYQLTGDVDDALFALDSVTGQLAFITPPDFENPQDKDIDNVYHLAITATDEAGNSSRLLVAITITGEILATLSKENISVYPNPVADYIQIRFKPHHEPKQIRVVSQSGVDVLTFEPIKNHLYDLSGLSAGIYFIRVDLPGKPQILYRIIKNK